MTKHQKQAADTDQQLAENAELLEKSAHKDKKYTQTKSMKEKKKTELLVDTNHPMAV